MSEQKENNSNTEFDKYSININGVIFPFCQIIAMHSYPHKEKEDKHILEIRTMSENTSKVMASKEKIKAIEANYKQWVIEQENKVKHNSFYNLEKDHFDKRLQQIEEALLEKVVSKFESALKESFSKTHKNYLDLEERLLKSQEAITKQTEKNSSLSKEIEDILQKVKEGSQYLDAFFTDLQDVREENEELQEKVTVKESLSQRKNEDKNESPRNIGGKGIYS